MKIIHKDIKHGEVKIKIDSAQDLWYLSNIIEPEDQISGMTERKIKIGGADEKSKVTRRMMHLKIIVEKIDTDSTASASSGGSTLRVTGRISEAPEDIPRGDYHTFDLGEGSIISIEKPHWTKYALKKLDESLTNHLANILIVAFDREEAMFAVLRNQGHEILLSLKGDVSKKDMEEKKTNFYQEIYKQILDYNQKYLFDNIVLASPAFWKEYLLKEIKDDSLKKKIVLATCSSIDDGTIHEVLRRPELKTVLDKDKATRELQIVEELLGDISKDNATYGLEHIKEKILSGNLAILLVSENLILKMRSEKTYDALEEVMENAENMTAELRIVSSDDAMKKLDGLTGIAGILRWRENYG
jgi:protein pelota